ncbi:MAG TPA: hypothetical protein VEF71_23895 [Streptosporangiaceae bacterium]|nr:hypothetical protein [Streptosporangiaceae bacterium]
MTTEDRELRRAMHGMLQSVPPSPAPLEAIIRRGKGIRLRRTGAAVGALGLAGIIAIAVLAPPGSRKPTAPFTTPAGPVAPGGVFAQGRVDGHAWRLAVQDIADPGYLCQPAIVLNGTDADPVYPGAGNLAAVTLGPPLSGIGFGFVQAPATVGAVTVNGQANVQVVTVAACGLRYHVAGFAYSLAHAVQVTMGNPPPGWQAVLTMPQVLTRLPSGPSPQQTAGMWINAYTAGYGEPTGPLDSSSVSGSDWTLQIQFGTGGDCYSFFASGSAGTTRTGACGPVSTPTGPETIMALPLAVSSDPATGLTGYAVQVSPATSALKATLSNGSSELATPCVVDGRDYAVLVVPSPLQLSRLTWLNAAGRVIASTAALPRYGWVQFQP